MNFQRRWQCAQILYIFKSDNTIKTEKGKGTECPTLSKKLLAIDTYWERKSVFFNGVSLGISTLLQSRLRAQE